MNNPFKKCYIRRYVYSIQFLRILIVKRVYLYVHIYVTVQIVPADAFQCSSSLEIDKQTCTIFSSAVEEGIKKIA